MFKIMSALTNQIVSNIYMNDNSVRSQFDYKCNQIASVRDQFYKKYRKRHGWSGDILTTLISSVKHPQPYKF